MKAFLMYPDRDFDPAAELPGNAPELLQDLELTPIIEAMARGDAYLADVTRKAILLSLRDPAEIRYRQAILRDCLTHPDVVRAMYALALETINARRREFLGIFTNHPSSIVYSSVKILRLLLDQLRQLKQLIDERAGAFESQGLVRLVAMLRRELDDNYFAEVQRHLQALSFRDGVLLSAELGRGNIITGYVLRKRHDPPQNWMERLFAPEAPGHTFYLHPRDEAGARALAEIEDRGLNAVANALAQAADHILSFVTMLRLELAFYVGCLNLYDQVTQIGMPLTLPEVAAPGAGRHRFTRLYDLSLALTMDAPVTGNDVNADGKALVMITGANRGGKSTFLRSIGQAQLLLQCGMFVPAESFCASSCTGVFTHFKRREDATMQSGKLDEELSRMSTLVDQLAPGALILFNESFAATNEREGAEIARQITVALLERRIRICFVTHLYEFARQMYAQNDDRMLFLRAPRQAADVEPFKLIVGAPLPTSYGEDVYRRVFGAAEPVAAG